jgi:hypothetical protein
MREGRSQRTLWPSQQLADSIARVIGFLTQSTVAILILLCHSGTIPIDKTCQFAQFSNQAI